MGREGTTLTHNQGQSEIKQSENLSWSSGHGRNQNFQFGQEVN